jgi:thioredoxin 1
MLRILIVGLLLLCPLWPAAAQILADHQVTPAILEFCRKPCRVCRESEKIVEAVRTMYPGQFAVRVIYIDEDQDMFHRYQAVFVPTQVFLDATGKEVFRHEWAFTKEQLIEKLKELKFIKE